MLYFETVQETGWTLVRFRCCKNIEIQCSRQINHIAAIRCRLNIL